MEWLFFGVLLLGLVGVYKSLISFPLFMILIMLLTGLIWLIDSLIFKKRRSQGAADPATVDIAKSIFPVILLVFVIRSFVAEPFKIPSPSMMPTLIAGDYILVNKYTYGLRVPIFNDVFIAVNKPERGDVLVFHYPVNPSIDFIKRVVGLPGDKIQYQDKQLIINGKPVELTDEEEYKYDTMAQERDGREIEMNVKARRLHEQLGSTKHEILIHDLPNRYDGNTVGEKLMNGETVTVPDGHYFAMGDNRDNSSDGRVWGFVPEKNLVGKAFFIWFNFGQPSRIGNSII